jgi:hypothetical protein
MIRGKRNDAYGGKTLRVDCCGWKSYREAVSYIIRQITTWDGFVIFSAYVYKHILRDLWNALIIEEEL